MPAAPPFPLRVRVLTSLLALTFVITGIGKLAAIPPSPANFARWGYSPTFMHAIGAIELLAGLLLLFPRTAPFAALALLCTMAGALKTGIQFGEVPHIALPLLLAVLLAYVVFACRETLRSMLGIIR